ncbi:MAG: hypothetical protein ACMUIP_13220 [bacterium]
MIQKRYSLFFYCLICLYLVSPFYAHAEVTVSEDKWIRYTVTDGLNSDWILSIAFDRNSRVWVSPYYFKNNNQSIDGINMFDGKSWEKYTLEPENPSYPIRSIDSMIIDINRDILWAGSRIGYERPSSQGSLEYAGQGLIRYEIGTKKTTIYKTSDSVVQLWGDRITALAMSDDNILWIASSDIKWTTTGLSWYNVVNKEWGRIEPDTNSPLGTSDIITSITVDKKNNVWAVIQKQGIDNIIVINSSTKTEQNTFTTENKNIDLSSIASIATDAEGDIWVGSHGGLSHYDSSQGQWIKKYDSKNTDGGMVGDMVKSICVDTKEENYIYLCTQNEYTKSIDVSRLNMQTEQCSLLPPPPTSIQIGLYNIIYDMKMDNAGILWIAAETGLYRYDAQDRQPDPPPRPVIPGPGIFDDALSADNNGCFLNLLAPWYYRCPQMN